MDAAGLSRAERSGKASSTFVVGVVTVDWSCDERDGLYLPVFPFGVLAAGKLCGLL